MTVIRLLSCIVFFFFKQKTAYEMRISDWSSDVCSSDLERRYVDALIRKLGVRLDAPTYNLGAVDVTRAVLPRFPLPYAAHFFQAIAAEHSRIEATEPVTAYFSGNGGDNVFCSLNSAAPLAARLLANGPGPGAFTTARDLAALTGSGLIEVARHAWVRIPRRRGPRVRPPRTGLGPQGLPAPLVTETRHTR